MPSSASGAVARPGLQGHDHPARPGLGVTMFLPEEDRYSYSKERLESQISSLFGGRIAEELIFGAERSPPAPPTTSARDRDRPQHGHQVGPVRPLGPLTYSEEEGEVFLGRSVTQHKNVSDETAHAIDEEIRASSSTRNYEHPSCTRSCPDEVRDQHRQAAWKGAMAAALMKYETIDSGADQIDDIMAGQRPSRVRRRTGPGDPPRRGAGLDGRGTGSRHSGDRAPGTTELAVPLSIDTSKPRSCAQPRWPPAPSDQRRQRAARAGRCRRRADSTSQCA
jgi:cell division protease FtsH